MKWFVSLLFLICLIVNFEASLHKELTTWVNIPIKVGLLYIYLFNFCSAYFKEIVQTDSKSRLIWCSIIESENKSFIRSKRFPLFHTNKTILYYYWVLLCYSRPLHGHDFFSTILCFIFCFFFFCFCNPHFMFLRYLRNNIPWKYSLFAWGQWIVQRTIKQGYSVRSSTQNGWTNICCLRIKTNS